MFENAMLWVERGVEVMYCGITPAVAPPVTQVKTEEPPGVGLTEAVRGHEQPRG
jgi:hypothetical protein